MTSDLHRAIESKRARRRKMADLSAEEKLPLLDKLRIRAQTQRGSRRSAPIDDQNLEPESKPTEQDKKQRKRFALPSEAGRFGGRATASGVNYEVCIAALLSVKMLCGDRSSVFEIDGADLSAVTLQAPEHVDDIILELNRNPDSRIFVSAKMRGASIALTKNSLAFTDTIGAFMRQFFELSPSAKAKSRFVWAIPSSAGSAVTHQLLSVLDTHRKDAGDDSLQNFVLRSRPREREAFTSLIAQANAEWRKLTNEPLREHDLRAFLRMVYVEVYDFGSGTRKEREAEGEIRSHIAADPKQAPKIWQNLENFFGDANKRGIRVTTSSLRQALVSYELELKSPPDYADDIAKLRDLTTQNLSRLKEHTTLKFGTKSTDAIHIPRSTDLTALSSAVNLTHLLVTGEPGCGKSGLIHDLVKDLQAKGSPVVLLLAEEVFNREWKGAANLPGFTRPLDQILANWPDGARGFLITDALDAVRDSEIQKTIRNLLLNVKEGSSGWTIIASVREFDLKHSGQLREAFSGSGVQGHTCNDFADVSHFHVSRLSETQLDDLAIRRSDIRPFIESARKSDNSEGIHRSPFYLRLAADLLRAGVAPQRLADWNSPALLMRKFWEARIQEGADFDEREVALKSICQKMVEVRSMTVSETEISLSAPERKAIRELRSRGILKTPISLHGVRIAEDEIAFSHHLLHDYAIARSLIPKSSARFSDFATHNPLLPVFYRQSFLFALEELWDADVQREEFWQSALQLEGAEAMHGITRILAPILAARRVQSIGDLEPLLIRLTTSNTTIFPAQKALQHLASGLEDADEGAVRVGASAWCEFAEQLAKLLTVKTWLEGPLVNFIARLNATRGASTLDQKRGLNSTACALLAHHVSKEVSRGWPYAAMVATETLCRTFEAAPVEAERALLRLLAPERLSQFPHNDLNYLADNLKYLGASGRNVVRRLFESAFAAEPEGDQWENRGSAIMPLRFQTSDQWNSIHHSLANYYEADSGEDAVLMTEVACIAWNAVARRKRGRREREEFILATITFRGVECDLIGDYSHIWGRLFEPEENRILSHFEKLLREWAAKGDTQRLDAALDQLVTRSRTSLIWSVFIETGAAYPETLGWLLADILNEPTFLTHSDYAYAATELMSALHECGSTAQRERLEGLVLGLPKNVRLHKDESREPTPSWVEHAQNRLLGALKESNLVLDNLKYLFSERQAAKALVRNCKREASEVKFHTLAAEELVERRGIDLKEPANEEMFRLRKALEPFMDRDNKKLAPSEMEVHWHVIGKSERALVQYHREHPKMAEELWGYLVGACESIARQADWPKKSRRWQTVRRILIKAADDAVPSTSGDTEVEKGEWPSWGWPSPRIDAACGLPWLVYRLNHADSTVNAALSRLASDKSHPVRFNLARQLAALEKPAPDLMWELIDRFIANERKFSVLDALLHSMNWLWSKGATQLMLRLRRIADRAQQDAPGESKIHETLAYIYLFRFLRTGDQDCEKYVRNLIAECDTPRAAPALMAQLHNCRANGWLTIGDPADPDAEADKARSRIWRFFSELLERAQARLKVHCDAWNKLHEHRQPDADALKSLKENRDRASHLVDAVAMQLYFASGAADERISKDRIPLAPSQLCLFWKEASPLLSALAPEIHPHTADYLVKTLYHLLPCSPPDVFLLATKSIRSSSTAGFHHEPLAVGDVVKFVQRALADHREIFQKPECLSALLEVLDLFVEAGWSEARQLTHRLEEIYR